MSGKAITLLKVLLHGSISVEEITKYIDIDLTSIERNILILNEYLKEKGMNIITKSNNIYTLENKDDRFSDFFSKLDILSSKERQDIYCIRLLLNGYINLEKERQKIGVSRTTAIKDFKKVKEELEKNKIFLESKNSKGIFLKDKDSCEIRAVLCEKLIKLFIDSEFLSKQRKELLDEINVLDERRYVDVYKTITEKFKLRKSIFSYYAIYSMAIISKIKGDLKCKFDFIKEPEEIKQILNILDDILPLNLSENLKEIIAVIILKLKNYEYTDSDIKEAFEKYIQRLEEVLEFTLEEKSLLKDHMLGCFIIGYLNKKYNVLWVRKSPESQKCLEITEIIEKILDDIQIDMYYSDKIRLGACATNFFMYQEYKKNVKVLIVSRSIENNGELKEVKGLKSMYPNVSIDLESIVEFKFKTKEELDKYDFIISDTDNYSIKKLKKINTLNIKELQRCFVDYVLTKRLTID